jgi:hypothetical protein
MVFRWDPHPARVGPLLWATVFSVGWLAGLAVAFCIARRPAIGALIVLAAFLLLPVAQRYRPDSWCLVAALLFPGLLALLPLAAKAVIEAFMVHRDPPSGAVWLRTTPHPIELASPDPSNWQDD